MAAVLIQEERFDQVWPEIQALVMQHHREVARDPDQTPLDINVEQYRLLEEHGGMFILTLRHEGQLGGYMVLLVHYSLQSQTILCGMVDAYYVHPELRRLGYASELFQQMEACMRTRGVHRLFSHMKPYIAHPAFYEKLGWHETEIIYSKWIGQ